MSNGHTEPQPQAAPEQTQPPAEGPQPPVRRWLVLGASAVLSSVAVQNYVCYSRPPAGASPEAPATLTLDLVIEDAAQRPRWQQVAVPLKSIESTDRQIMWSGYDVVRRLQVIWVWDFFRIQSHVALRVMLPPEGAEDVNPTWQQALEGLRAVQPGDVLRVSVRSSCGDIFQAHPILAPVQEWTPRSARETSTEHKVEHTDG